MTDRELLDMAAKAAGYKLWWGITDPMIECSEPEHPRKTHNLWNPLEDDGDALRLAAALRLHIKPGKHKGDGCTVESNRNGIAGTTAFYDDKNEQMRRAIVLVAAEIGKAMP